MKKCVICFVVKNETDFPHERYRNRCKACGAARMAAHRIKAGARGRTAHNLSRAKTRASDKGLPFNLTLAEAYAIYDSQEGRCALSGLPMISGPLTRFSISIDRIKPELGYVPGNVRFLLAGVNDLKGTGTDEDVLTIAHALVETGILRS